MAASTSSSSTQLEGARKVEKDRTPEPSDSIPKAEVQGGSQTSAPETGMATIDVERQGPKEPEVSIGRNAAILLFIGYVHWPDMFGDTKSACFLPFDSLNHNHGVSVAMRSLDTSQHYV